MKEPKYYIIGGQYAHFCYGSETNLQKAIKKAKDNCEYWDNWQGWHYPDVYRAGDCEKINNFYGAQIAPKEGAIPIWWDYK